MSEKSEQKKIAKENSKVLQQRKHRRRQWISFVRMIRYGVNNFSRNAWLTVAATAVMTITLLIIFITVASQSILNDSVKAISEKVDMSIYLKTDTTDEDAEKIASDLRKLSNTREVRYISAAEARKQTAQKNKTNNEVLEALNEASNRLPATLRIQLKDINDTSQLNAFVNDNKNLKAHIHDQQKPSFSGTRRTAIEKIAGWTVLAQRIGLIASAVFIVISSLIIFNTIRMAIFSRKEEIQMMKLIGADKQFIRGPFIVEAMVYGFIAAIAATGIGYGVLRLTQKGLGNFGIDVQSTISLIEIYGGAVLFIMIILGAIIGTVSSLFATARYLKV